MATFEPERCYSCEKIFCCVDCCVIHIKNKHPGGKSLCPLCHSQPLIIGKINYPELLCHLVSNHLPLHCRTCGEFFETCDDLKTIGNCSNKPLICIQPPTFIESEKSTLNIETQSPVINTTVNPLIDTKGYTIVDDRNSSYKYLTSPPEFTRNTSTPMQIDFNKQSSNIIAKDRCAIPYFYIKTPSFSSRNENTIDNSSIKTPKYSLSETESMYHSLSSLGKSVSSDRTPIRPILLIKSSSEEFDQQEISKSFSQRKLTAMQELNEYEVDMELTDVQGKILTEMVKTPIEEILTSRRDSKDSRKKVRFSDQFAIKLESDANISSPNLHNDTETEEFFEAHQSFSEMPVIAKENRFESANNSNKDIFQLAQQTKDITGLLKKEEKIESSTSRIIMILVENNSNENPASLTPLINSGLKQLESAMSQSTKPNTFALNNKENTTGGFSIISVDSYTKVSTLEYSKVSENIPERCQQNITEQNTNSGGGGIFTAVANAVKNAFKNLSGTSLINNPNNEVTPLNTNNSQIIKIPKYDGGDSEKSFPCPSSRPAKRSRDEVDQVQNNISNLTEHQGNDIDNDIRSPLQKRRRGWYRQIRGREPIARMRGVALGTQCFQQGSLSMGDYIIPLPSRAHQATQTD